MSWDPALYAKFKNERSLPFFDLADQIVVYSAKNALDLGCGSGELTATLFNTLPNANILGIDSSPEMLSASRSYENDRLRFQLGDQTQFDGKYDLIISNASIQWSPDHHQLLPAILEHLTNGGQLLVQVPSNHGGPLHLLVAEVARQQPFAGWLNGYTRVSPVLTIEEYAAILFKAGIEKQNVFEKVYAHILSSRADVLDWISGTALIPYKERLSADQFSEFTFALAATLPNIYPNEPVFYPFTRIFISAIKGT